jgi:predicted CxxxxCH...CXXCH cytochrome family protein
MFRFLLILVLPALSLVAQNQPPTVKKVPAAVTPAWSGDQMFKSYCASCHGVDAKGSGPAAAALKMPIPDLTTISKRHGGAYPELQVVSAVRGDVNVTAHGSKDMPVWGHVFREMNNGGEKETQLRVRNLVKYIESLQQK